VNEENAFPSLREFLASPGFAYELRRSAIAFGVLLVLSFGASLALPELRDQVVSQLFRLAENVTDEENTISMWMLLSNNLTACGYSILYGLLPFVYLPALSLGMNAIILGSLGGWYVANGYPVWVYLAGLLPHGIFELPALVLSFSGGLYLCGQINRRIRKRPMERTLFQSISCVSRVYVTAVAPLLLAAAFLEAYVTPLFLSLFLSV